MVLAVAGCSSMGAPGAAEVRSSIEKANSECRLQRESRISLDGLFVVTIDGGELEVVRVEGRIGRLMAEALAEDLHDDAGILADLTGS